MSSGPILLLDGDLLIFQTLAALEHDTNWGDDIWTLHVNEEQALGAVKARLQRLAVLLKPSSIAVCLSDPDANWRKDVDPSYKANRKDTRKPIAYAHCRDYVLENYDKPNLRAIRWDRLEADDLMGILATKPSNEGRTLILSDDKDMQGIPGALLSLSWEKRGEFEVDAKGAKVPKPRVITEVEADLFHLVQTIAGDPVDGYSGCPGVGGERARRQLESGQKVVKYLHTFKTGKRKGETEARWKDHTARSDWEIVVSLFNKAGLDEAEALRQAQMARILRWEDWDHDKKEPILWTPS